MKNPQVAFEQTSLASLQQWAATRTTESMPPELVVYCEKLERVYAWHQSSALEGEIINNLLLHYPDFKGDRSAAKAIYSDAINHFYLDSEITQEAWANVYADRLDKLALAILKTAETSADIARAEKAWEKAAQCRGVFAERRDDIPAECYEKRYNIYTSKLKDLGLPPQSRPEIMEMISKFSLPADETMRLNKEAGTQPKEVLDWLPDAKTKD